MPYFAKLVLFILAVYLAAAGYVFFMQRHMLYLPDKSIRTPADYGLADFQELSLPGEAGRLQAWYAPASAGRPLVIYLHGNGGNLGYRAAIYRALASQGYGVLALSWRGYGKSAGSPSETGLLADARTAIAYAHDTLGLPPERLVYFGESLGTGVAVRMAVEQPPALLVLRSPYTSVAARAQEMFPWLPVSLLLRDKFDTLSLIPRLHTPLLIVHGDQDTVIPYRHAQALYDAASEPKRLVKLRGQGHNHMDMGAILSAMESFARDTEAFRP